MFYVYMKVSSKLFKLLSVGIIILYNKVPHFKYSIYVPEKPFTLVYAIHISSNIRADECSILDIICIEQTRYLACDG